MFRDSKERNWGQVEQNEIEKQTHDANKSIENKTTVGNKRNKKRRKAVQKRNKNKREAVETIQRVFRGSWGRTIARAKKQAEASIKIQSLIRKLQQKQKFKNARNEAKKAEASTEKIQSLVRKNQQQKKFQKEKEAVETIQKVYRDS